jgi:hypothetical protein
VLLDAAIGATRPASTTIICKQCERRDLQRSAAMFCLDELVAVQRRGGEALLRDRVGALWHGRFALKAKSKRRLAVGFNPNRFSSWRASLSSAAEHPPPREFTQSITKRISAGTSILRTSDATGCSPSGSPRRSRWRAPSVSRRGSSASARDSSGGGLSRFAPPRP